LMLIRLRSRLQVTQIGAAMSVAFFRIGCWTGKTLSRPLALPVNLQSRTNTGRMNTGSPGYRRPKKLG
jgi:hypothetical protein